MNKGKFREIFEKQVRKNLSSNFDKFLSNKKFELVFENKSSGFALIEVIVSIVILAIVLSAAVGLLYTVGTAVEANRNRLTATYLAQECLELVRNSRDTAWRNHQKWDCAWGSDPCSDIADILPAKNKTVVKVDDKETKFSREFEVKTAEDKPSEAMITCTVSWGESDKLSISQILTNWRKR